MTMPQKVETFFRRIKLIYDAWRSPDFTHDDDALTRADCLTITNDFLHGAANIEREINRNSDAFQIWLFGFEIKTSIMVFTDDTVYIMAHKAYLRSLNPHILNEDNHDLPYVKWIGYNYEPNNSQDIFEKVLGHMSASKEGKTIGVFARDRMMDDFCESWKSALDEKNYEYVDITASIEYIMGPKDEKEILRMTKACWASVDTFDTFLKKEILKIIAANEKVTHKRLSQRIWSVIHHENEIRRNVGRGNCYNECQKTIIQSGGNYTLGFDVESDDNHLHFGAIVCSLGISYKEYCSSISRTILVNPTNQMQDNYNFLLHLEEELLRKLVPGTKLNEVYEFCVTYTGKEKPELIDNLTKKFGILLGIRDYDISLNIGPECNAVVQSNMVFNVFVGLSGLINEEAIDDEGKEYALFVGDSVLVNEDGPASILTQPEQ